MLQKISAVLIVVMLVLAGSSWADTKCTGAQHEKPSPAGEDQGSDNETLVLGQADQDADEGDSDNETELLVMGEDDDAEGDEDNATELLVQMQDSAEGDSDNETLA